MKVDHFQKKTHGFPLLSSRLVPQNSGTPGHDMNLKLQGSHHRITRLPFWKYFPYLSESFWCVCIYIYTLQIYPCHGVHIPFASLHISTLLIPCAAPTDTPATRRVSARVNPSITKSSILVAEWSQTLTKLDQNEWRVGIHMICSNELSIQNRNSMEFYCDIYI